MTYEEVEWCSDAAASGPRERTWIDDADGNRLGEIVVYPRGEWRVYSNRMKSQATGYEKDFETAKRRAFIVFQAMTREIESCESMSTPKR